MTNFMIDIETTGLNPGVNHITSCAIVPFDLETGAYSKHVFYERFLLDIPGRTCNIATMDYRLKKNIERYEKTLDCRESLVVSLYKISNFIASHCKNSDAYIWAKPSHFDIAFLESYYRQCGSKIPWGYRNIRDLATYLQAAGHNLVDLYEEIKFTGDAHNALHDCHYQILLANLGYRSLCDRGFV